MLESKKKQVCKTLNTLVKLSQNADESLWESYKLSLQKEYDQIRLSRLIFPIYSGKQEETLRVSEQEARFAFVESIQKSNLLYSVETPTSLTSHSTKKHISEAHIVREALTEYLNKYGKVT
jgi:hypothetical protein